MNAIYNKVCIIATKTHSNYVYSKLEYTSMSSNKERKMTDRAQRLTVF